MSIAAAYWFWLLAAIAVPVAIHLWSRKSGKPQLLGTFRFLPDESFSKAGRIDLHEIPLLLIRIIMVILVTLLLAGLFWQGEKEVYNSIRVLETDGEYRENLDGENILEIEIPTEMIETAGWWNILKQVEADFNPELIVVNGNLETNHFKGARPRLSADIEWVLTELPDEVQSVTWETEIGAFRALVQKRTGQTASWEILPLAGPEPMNEAVQHYGFVKMTVQTGLPESIQTGLEYTAGLWNIDMETGELPGSQIAEIENDINTVVLQHLYSQNDVVDVIKPVEITGIEIEISKPDTFAIAFRPLLEGRDYGIPILWFSDQNTLIINGTSDSDSAPWLFAGISHQLIKKSLSIKRFSSPVLPDEQREIVKADEPTMAGTTPKKSLRTLLLIALLLFWAAERYFAPARGM